MRTITRTRFFMRNTAKIYLASHGAIDFSARKTWSAIATYVPDSLARQFTTSIIDRVVSIGASPFSDFTWIEGAKLFESEGSKMLHATSSSGLGSVKNAATGAASVLAAIPSLIREYESIRVFVVISKTNSVLTSFKSVQRETNELARNAVFRREVCNNLLERIQIACDRTLNCGSATVICARSNPVLSPEQFAMLTAPDYNRHGVSFDRIHPEILFIDQKWSPVMQFSAGIACSVHGLLDRRRNFAELVAQWAPSIHEVDGKRLGYGVVVVPRVSPSRRKRADSLTKSLAPLISSAAD